MTIIARQRPGQKEVVSKTFAFRCKWVEVERGAERPDGYSYAITRDALDHMIAVRRRNNEPGCYSTASDIKVVPIDARFYALIQKQKSQCFTTLEDKHPQDYEVDHGITKSVI